MIKALTAIASLLALVAAAVAKQTPVEPADINTGSVGTMRENIGSVGAMRERDYFGAPHDAARYLIRDGDRV